MLCKGMKLLLIYNLYMYHVILSNLQFSSNFTTLIFILLQIMKKLEQTRKRFMNYFRGRDRDQSDFGRQSNVHYQVNKLTIESFKDSS